MRWRSGSSAPKKRRPEQDPGEHLAHHPRLADLHRQRADQPREQHHDRDRDEERGKGVPELALLLGDDPLLADHEREITVGGGPGDLGLAAARASDRARELALAVDELALDAGCTFELHGVVRAGQLALAAQAGRPRDELVVAAEVARRRGLLGPGIGRVAGEVGLQGLAADRPDDGTAADGRLQRRLAPVKQLTSPVSRPSWKRSLPVVEPSARCMLTNWPDWRRSNCGPRQAWPAVTS